MARNILLLNPPGRDIYFREYYCAKVSKGRYYYQPVDLVYLSGRFPDNRVAFLDCIAQRMPPGRALAFIKNGRFDTIVALTSTLSYPEDAAFFAQLDPTIELVVTGDLVRSMKSTLLEENPRIQAACADFSTDAVARYLDGERSGPIDNMWFRRAGKIVDGKEIHGKGIWDVPPPRWEMFCSPRYAMPFSRRRGMMTMLTDFGCAFSCGYCPIGTIPMKLRPLADVMTDFAMLRALGIRELFIQDQTFCAARERTLELLTAMERFGFSFCCHSRLDVLDERMLASLKRAGCHTLLLGVEIANRELLNGSYKKSLRADTAEVIRMIKAAGINTCASLLIGLPGESEEDILATIEMACRIPFDYASFNIVTPRPGTALYEQAIDKGWFAPGALPPDSAYGLPLWHNLALSNQDILRLHRHARRKFFMRPGHLFKQILLLRTPYEFFNKLSEWRSIVAHR
jgi:anaerobic magnesium-protoporphyrin IX monomethyl ester cyclase